MDDATQSLDPARGLWQLWRRGARPDVREYLAALPAMEPRSLASVLRVDQRARWDLGERVPAAEYLRDFPALQGDPEAAFELIYGEFLIREGRGETPGLEEFQLAYPDFAGRLASQVRLHRALGGLTGHDSGTEVGSTDESWSLFQSGSDGDLRGGPSAAGLPALEGYEILEELGRGGMGVVFKARQVRLNRVVALKMIRAGDLATPESLARFLQEAELIARLRHANIVQVYGIGEHEGRPYIELEYMAGGSLDRRIDGTPWPAREAARLVETLARATHEAHRQGIVHRDLKPANVLLDEQGVPKVTDFGLAKCLELDSGLTRSQAVLGSPRYMAPEQAAGAHGRVGPATDVYALGVILYELLTGRPPFLAETTWETLALVQSREPVPPSRLQARLPRDLETICLKCLRKEPSRRYAGAEDLAEDLQRFLEGRPIKARPVGAPERLWRWCRRRPTQAALATALVLALAGGFAGVATQWWRAEAHLEKVRQQRGVIEANYGQLLAAHRDTQSALDREQTARKRAQARFDLTLKAVNGFTALATENELLRVPSPEPLRNRLLARALEFYEALRKELDGDPTPQARGALSASLARMAFIHYETGSKAEALDAFRQALQMVEDSVAETPDDPQRRSALARAHLRIGLALRGLGRHTEALRSFGRSREILETLVREHPAIARFRDELAWSIGNIAAVLDETGHPDQAISACGPVLEIRAALVRENPTNLQMRSDLAWCQLGLSMSLRKAGRPEEAMRRVREGLSILEPLAQARPADTQAQDRMARGLLRIGYIQRDLGRYSESRASVERASAILEALARDYPLGVGYQTGLVDALLLEANLLADAGQLAEALGRIDRAERLLRRISAADARDAYYDLACAYATCHAASRRDGADPAPAGGSARDEHADRAMRALSRAVAAGFRDLAMMRRDPDLDPLRSRPDFQAVLADVAFPAEPFARGD